MPLELVNLSMTLALVHHSSCDSRSVASILQRNAAANHSSSGIKRAYREGVHCGIKQVRKSDAQSWESVQKGLLAHPSLLTQQRKGYRGTLLLSRKPGSSRSKRIMDGLLKQYFWHSEPVWWTTPHAPADCQMNHQRYPKMEKGKDSCERLKLHKQQKLCSLRPLQIKGANTFAQKANLTLAHRL